MPKYDAYVICTSPRSGSTLLCDLLKGTGVSGRPGSLFHEPSLEAWHRYYDQTRADFPTDEAALKAIFEAAIRKGSCAAGMFGLRLQRASFEFFMEQLAILHPDTSGEGARTEAAFGRTLFIHLTRADKLEQAISYVKAQQSGLWHRAADGSELERLAPPAEPEFDAIAKIRAQMIAFDQDWLAWFDREGMEPLRLEYDALGKDPLGVLWQVLEALGLDPSVADGVEPGVSKLADATSAEWAARFRAGAVGA